jgi:hypothetical protein
MKESPEPEEKLGLFFLFYVYIFLAPLYLGLTLKNSSVYYLPFPENPSRQIKLGEVY